MDGREEASLKDQIDRSFLTLESEDRDGRAWHDTYEFQTVREEGLMSIRRKVKLELCTARVPLPRHL